MDRRVKKTKRAIQTALITLLQKHIFTEITVSELARTADIDRKTFYLHYHSINDVLDEFEAELTQQVSDIINASDRFNLDSFIDSLTHMMLEKIDIFAHISKNNDYSFLLDDCKNILAEALLKESKTESTLGREELDFITHFIAYGLVDTYKNWLKTPTRSEIELKKTSLHIKKLVSKLIQTY